MKYAHYDQATGDVIGFYSDDIHSEIPSPNVELTEDEWLPLLGRSLQYLDGQFLDKQPPAPDYRLQRAAEYPDFRDYLDGIVKNDQTQIDAYIAACQAVKAKYPKV
jgi:hypothetical protein